MILRSLLSFTVLHCAGAPVFFHGMFFANDDGLQSLIRQLRPWKISVKVSVQGKALEKIVELTATYNKGGYDAQFRYF